MHPRLYSPLLSQGLETGPLVVFLTFRRKGELQ